MADAFGTAEDDGATYERFAALVRARRTSMSVDHEREVPAEIVAELCGLATWAPNHKRTWPWRFALFTGGARGRLGRTMVDDMVAAGFGDEGKRRKTLTKYERTPAVLAVGCAPSENELLHVENRDAVAAGIQNLLLGATALGLASFWSSPALTRPARVLELCGFQPDDRLVGLVYLGWAAEPCPPPERPTLPITHLTA